MTFKCELPVSVKVTNLDLQLVNVSCNIYSYIKYDADQSRISMWHWSWHWSVIPHQKCDKMIKRWWVTKEYMLVTCSIAVALKDKEKYVFITKYYHNLCHSMT